MNAAPAHVLTPARRVYVVDDDEPFRRSLMVLLKAAGWEAEGFASCLEFAERSHELEPGILLLDVNLGDGSGLDLIERDPSGFDHFAVVMMTGAGEIATAVRSIKAGATDFIEKPFLSEELLARLNAIDNDFAATLQSKSAARDARRRVAKLSPRERDVLERLLSGASNKLIARDLDLSPRTVEMHRARMLDKLGAGTTGEALEIGRLAEVRAVQPASG
jgi:two-component system response regulator FixJ